MLLASEEHHGKLAFFMAIDQIKFRKPVVPGDQLKLVVEVVKFKRDIWVFEGKAYVDNEIVTEARIMAMLKKALP